MTWKPNYFIAFRLQSPDLRCRFFELQNQIVARSPKLNKCKTSEDKIHFTGFVLSLNSATEVDEAIACFSSCTDIVRNLVSECRSQKIVSFGKLNSFGKKALYLEPLDSPALDMLHNIVISMRNEFLGDRWNLSSCIDPSFLSLKSTLTGDQTSTNTTTAPPSAMPSPEAGKKFHWVPHATVMKTSADRKNGRSLEIKITDYEGLESMIDGIDVSLCTVELLYMGDVEPDGYYKIISTISLCDLK